MVNSIQALTNPGYIVDPGAQMAEDDTMTLRNPQWARWFDQIKQAAGGKSVQFGPKGGINDLPTSPNGPGMSDLQYGNGLGVQPFSQGGTAQPPKWTLGIPSFDALGSMELDPNGHAQLKQKAWTR